MELKVLYQDKDIDNYIAQFRTITARTGIIQEVALIEFFLDELDSPIVQQLFLMETPPTILKATYTTAARVFQNLQHTKNILARGREQVRASQRMEKDKQDREVKVTISHLSLEERE
jgi:hypothetical protein